MELVWSIVVAIVWVLAFLWVIVFSVTQVGLVCAWFRRRR